jgi:hypothetical protein
MIKNTTNQRVTEISIFRFQNLDKKKEYQHNLLILNDFNGGADGS